MKKNNELLIIILSTALILVVSIAAIIVTLKVDTRLIYLGIGAVVVALCCAVIVYFENKARQQKNSINVTQKPIVTDENGVKVVVVDEERTGE